jgi:hypothetical protein
MLCTAMPPSLFPVERLNDGANHATQELRQLDGVKPHAYPSLPKLLHVIQIPASSHEAQSQQGIPNPRRCRVQKNGDPSDSQRNPENTSQGAPLSQAKGAQSHLLPHLLQVYCSNVHITLYSTAGQTCVSRCRLIKNSGNVLLPEYHMRMAPLI